jgi:hypothetical protein
MGDAADKLHVLEQAGIKSPRRLPRGRAGPEKGGFRKTARPDY